ncbi:ADP-ribosylation factor-binding protein GGA2 [Psilocybe cubensis]|uniref:VHS-domain-containing protein n=2 Tax=Psilocybe cubensis TaxID=181762 RepID=A0A8H7XNC8_PSICU|nr:ADP-ribosylation factor-binding protein GGA2 [Psilocybe cubensis]KAH9476198.1 ADP-ribosylation factor-binding protein GGA2 [Psilocybe cubensis]
MLHSPTGPSSWLRVSPLEVLITRACEPSLHEPNYALHLEVAEYINQKKANNPREAAMMLARLANHRNPHVAILALSLLDTLVQSCGYPFHLQVSTKEFLNELVRRFPERPPPFPGPVMSRILELINGWKEGICVESRWKEDLGNIRDMHRLLTFKGYRFRDAPRASNAAANATANLKSAEELEEEDRAAQSAKLQELIRRGTPRDLAAAQELMKSLAGANPDAKPDYRSQALTELNKLEQKVILLNEMLDNVDAERGERFVTGDAYDQVSSILITARPKLQKWISDAETEDPESLDTFLQINDQINTVLSRYEAFKKGDYTFASNPIPQELSNGGSSSNAGVSLIDFDDAAPSTSSQPVSNDLSGLFSSPPIQPLQQQPLSVGGSFGLQQQQQQQPFQTHSPTPLFHNGAGFVRPASMSPPNAQSATPPASIVLPGTPQPAPSQLHMPSQSPNYFSNPVNTGKAPIYSGMGMTPGTTVGGVGFGGMGGQPQQPFGSFGLNPQPQPHVQFHAQQPIQPTQTSNTASTSSSGTAAPAAGQQAKDPFADLAGLF